MEKFDFRDENFEVIDLFFEGGVVFLLRESMIEFIKDDKVCNFIYL